MGTGRNRTTVDDPGFGNWENEGGSLKPHPPVSLPEGITAVTSVRFHVGPYSYTKLDDALAENRRQLDKLRSCAKSV